ncbi:MAG: M48 family metallopeptidase [Opitutales bacterium]
MDFFEAQDQAQSRTKLLVFYFIMAVLFIVTAVYFAVTAGVFYYHHKVQSPEPAVLINGSRLLFTLAGVVPLIALGSFWRIQSLRRQGGPGVAEAMGGRKVDPGTKRPGERQLMNVVEEMAIASGVPVPDVYLLDDEEGINAFAAGFDLNDAAVGVTRGALEQLDRNELQGVIAHEFSHILNGDMRLSTKLAGWIFGIVMLTLLGRGFWAQIGGGGSGSSRRSGDAFFMGGGTRGRSRGGGSSKGSGGALIIAIIIVAVLVTIIGFIGEFFGRLIQAAVSRQREYLADASAVQFTRNPEGLGNALRRIGGVPRQSLVSHPKAGEFAHAFFSKSLKSEVSFLATHPPLKKRIRRVLKDWNGDYLNPRPKPKSKLASKKTPSKAEMPHFGQRVQQSSGQGSIAGMLSAGLFIRAIGQMQEQGRAFAEKARAELQDTLPEAFEDKDQSPLYVLALLLHTEAPAREKQLEALAEYLPEDTEAISACAVQLKDLDRATRLVFLEMMTARLPDAVAAPDGEEFLECVAALIRADGKVAPFEVACLQMVRRRLLEDSEFATGRRKNQEIIHAARTLATRLAQETDLKGAAPADILDQATRQAPYFMNQLTPVDSVTLEDLNEAFTILAQASFGLRKQFLQICERIVAADETATMDEVELLRAIAIGLSVPAAPIFPETTD